MNASDDLALARAVRDAALGTRGVDSMGSGRYAEAATYGAYEKVVGVVIGPDEISVHVVAVYPEGTPIPDLADRVRDQVSSLVSGRRVAVIVDDIKTDEQ